MRRGELLAYNGTIGPSSGPHLHYEIRTDLTAGSHSVGTQLTPHEGKTLEPGRYDVEIMNIVGDMDVAFGQPLTFTVE